MATLVRFMPINDVKADLVLPLSSFAMLYPRCAWSGPLHEPSFLIVAAEGLTLGVEIKCYTCKPVSSVVLGLVLGAGTTPELSTPLSLQLQAEVGRRSGRAFCALSPQP